jgi:hypothetical protein
VLSEHEERRPEMALILMERSTSVPAGRLSFAPLDHPRTLAQPNPVVG